MPKTYADDLAATLPLFSSRVFGSVTNTILGSAVPAGQVGASSSGGHYMQPIVVPDDMDVSASSSLKVFVAPAANSLVNGQYVRFTLVATTMAHKGARVDTSFNYDWPVPDGWLASDNELVTLDNGSGFSFDPDLFTPGQLVGFRITRDGPNAADTFAQSLLIAQHGFLEYTTGVGCRL